MRLLNCLITATTLVLASVQAAAQAPGAALESLRQHSRSARSDALLVIRDGRVLIDEKSDPSAEPAIEMMSATKGVVALAVMKLVSDGRVASLDMPVHSWYPEWRQGRKQAITLRMLLNHTSGMQNVANAGREVEPARDAIQLALAAELDADPGTRFAYNNKATNLLAGIVHRVSGMPLDIFARDNLFNPLGIVAYRWRKDPSGNPLAMAGLHLAASDAAKLGQLVLDRGRWSGKPLIRADLIDTLVAPGSKISPDLGLMWARTPAFRHYTLDRTGLARLQAIDFPPDLIDRLRPLGDKSIHSRNQLRTLLQERLGADGMAQWARRMTETGNSAATIFSTRTGPVAAYHAEGYLGQYIVVVPQARMVAVRQYRARPDMLPGDTYPDFVEDVLALASEGLR